MKNINSNPGRPNTQTFSSLQDICHSDLDLYVYKLHLAADNASVHWRHEEEMYLWYSPRPKFSDAHPRHVEGGTFLALVPRKRWEMVSPWSPSLYEQGPGALRVLLGPLSLQCTHTARWEWFCFCALALNSHLACKKHRFTDSFMLKQRQKHFSYDEGLRELIFFRPDKRRLRDELIWPYSTCRDWTKKMEKDIFQELDKGEWL